MNGWEGGGRRRSPAMSAVALSTLALAITASGEVNVERLDDAKVTRLIVHDGDGSVTRGTVATGSLGPVLLYHADATEWITGCWGSTCGFGFADELLFWNLPRDGGELSSYTFSYAAGYGASFGLCDDCTCYDGNVDPPYTVTAALYDGPPPPTGSGCGSGLPIPGTEVQFQTNASRALGNEIIEVTVQLQPKVFVPDEVWGVVTADIEDAWMAIGAEPTTGTSWYDGALWLDSDSDGCWDEWECWWEPSGIPCPGSDCSWATFHAEANAERAFFLIPVPPPEDSQWAGSSTYTIDGNQAVLSKGGEPVWMEVWVTDWDPSQLGIQLRAYKAIIESSGYSSGLQGTLTPYTVEGACLDDLDCAALGTGGRCVRSNACRHASSQATCAECADLGLPCACDAGFIDNTRTDYVFYGLMELYGTLQDTWGYWFSSVTMAQPADSPGRDSYVATLRLWVPDDAKGTFTISFAPVPDSYLVNYYSEFIRLVGLQSGKITVDFGACCFDLAGEERQCVEGVTSSECDALSEPRLFALGGHCTGDICADCGQCQENSHCDDGDACTHDICDVEATCTCTHSPDYDVDTECCDPDTGALEPLDDGDPCTLLGICDPTTGEVTRPPAPPGTSCGEGDTCVFGYYCDGAGSCVMDPAPVESACDDGDECTTDDHCDGAGNCVVDPIAGRACVNKRACEPGSCVDGACRCPAEFVPVPTVSGWGAVIVALVLIVLGKTYFGRRRTAG